MELLDRVNEVAGSEGIVVDPQARRFAYVVDGQVYPATLDGLAYAYEQSCYSGDAPWGQLYAVHEAELVLVRLTPIHRPYADAGDFIHEAHAVVDQQDSCDRDGRRYFGTIYTTIDGRT